MCTSVDGVTEPDEAQLPEPPRPCAWCRIDWTHGAWLNPNRFVGWLSVPDQKSIPGLTHGICAECVLLQKTGADGRPKSGSN